MIVAPKLGSGESMPDRAGVGAMLGNAHLGDRGHNPIRASKIWAFAAFFVGCRPQLIMICSLMSVMNDMIRTEIRTWPRAKTGVLQF